jgi:hypothetical protein
MTRRFPASLSGPVPRCGPVRIPLRLEFEKNYGQGPMLAYSVVSGNR